MNQRYAYILLFFMMLGMGTVAAQEPVAQIRIGTSVNGARFEVDGVEYQAAQTFFWSRGSKHIISITPGQDSRSTGSRYQFAGWTLGDGSTFSQNPTATVTADPSIGAITATVTLEHKINLYFYECPNPLVPCTGGNGKVTVNGQVYYGGTELWLAAGSNVTMTAEPFAGFVFGGWGQAFGTDLDRRPSLTFVHDRPRNVFARFDPAKLIRLQTNPPDLKVLVDRTPVQTPADVDWAFGTAKLLGGVSPQRDAFGRLFIFEGFEGLPKGQNVLYTPAVGDNGLTVLTARFIPGAAFNVSTQPAGLKLKVQGSDNPVGYNFYTAVGSKVDIEAPLEQTDSNGRKYIFEGWSNGGDAIQTITVPEKGMNLVARYRKLPRVIVDTNPSGYTVQIDGTACRTPCPLEREADSTVRISAPAAASLSSELSRMEFIGWTDGVPETMPERTVTFDVDAKTVVARYVSAHKVVVAANPGKAARIKLTPASVDGFYRFGTNVTMTVEANPGYRFRRWEGDLTGTFANAVLTVNGPKYAVANFDVVPFTDPAGVRNAAGETPEPGVAPGSIGAIIGANLVSRTEQGASAPLAQTLGGAVVRLGTRLLPLFWVSPERIDFQVPSDLEPGTYRVTVQQAGEPEVSSEMLVVRNSPGIFTRDDSPGGQTPLAVAYHVDGSAVTLEAPAAPGEQVTVLATGAGPYDLLSLDGFALPDFITYKLTDAVSVLLGDQIIAPSFAGGRGGQVGVNSIRFTVSPEAAPGSTLELKLSVNGKLSNTTALPIRP